MPELHARFGGSTIERTIECPGWRQLADSMPPQGSSSHADRGTLLHNAMEEILLSDDPKAFMPSVVGMRYKDLVLTEAMYQEAIVPAFESLQEIFTEYNVTDYTCEERVELMPDTWGTADILATGSIDVDGEIIKVGLCLDYKFGYNIVEAEGNQQGLFYSAAAAVTKDTMDLFEGAEIVVVGIIQPNDQGLPNHSVWEVDANELKLMREKVIKSVALAKEDTPPLASGKWCKYCPSEATCPVRTGEYDNAKRLDVTNPEVLVNLPSMAELKRVEDQIKAVRALVREQLELGVSVHGRKLVAGSARRVYNDTDKVVKKIKNSRSMKIVDFMDMQLKSPAQLEKVCRAKGIDYDEHFAPMISKMPGANRVVSEDAKGESIVPPTELLSQIAARLPS